MGLPRWEAAELGEAQPGSHDWYDHLLLACVFGNAVHGLITQDDAIRRKAKAAADLMATVWEAEFPATCQVLAEVKDDNRHYKPDAKSRTAWELATHLADPRLAELVAGRQLACDLAHRHVQGDATVAFLKRAQPGGIVDPEG